MNKVTIVGSVFPNCVKINYSGSPKVRFPNDEITDDIFLEIAIQDSRILIEIDVNGYEPTMIAAIHKRAFDLTSSILNMIGFKQGLGLTFILETYQVDTGQVTEILLQDKSLELLAPSLRDPISMNKVFLHLLENFVLSRALNDLVDCLKSPHVVPINCARAIEAISNFMGNSENRNKIWENMRTKLNLSKEYITFITETSKRPRHGNALYLDGKDTAELNRRSWVIMDRYFQFFLNGSKKLDEVVFPFLDEA